jgi:hypothetical protein
MAIFKWITSPFTREEVQMTLTAYEQYWGTKMAVYRSSKLKHFNGFV